MCFISIILPTYNRGSLCSKVIDQIINQTFENWELVIVDDGSESEHTQIILDKIKHINKIKIIHNTSNLGLPKSINIGIKYALNNQTNNSEYITWISDDNIYYEIFLEKLLEFNNNKKIIYARHFVNSTPRKIYYKDFNDILANWRGCQACVYHKSIFEEIGYFAENLMLVEDMEMFLRIFYKYTPDNITYIDAYLMEFIKHKNSLSTTKKNEVIWLSKNVSLIYNLLKDNNITGYKVEHDIKCENNILFLPEKYIEIAKNLNLRCENT